MGDDSTTEFYFNFPFYTNTDIVVLKNNQTATDYTIIGTSAGLNADIPYTGGKIVFNIAPVATDSITIYRHLPLTRTVDYQPTEKINPTILNQDMNYMMEVLKDTQDKIDMFAERYNEIINKESTDNLLSKIHYLNQLIDNDEIINKYVSNCITKIPQDITFTLSNGTLTLKAGSKCYLKTDTTTPSVTISSDLTTTQTTDGTYFAIYDGSALTTVLTTTYDYSTLPSTYSLPLAIVTVSSGAISSINQVFNGFGYIGSTVFVLPGVKGLIPQGRNTDGTLKNNPFTVNTVLAQTFSGTYIQKLVLNGSGMGVANATYNEITNYTSPYSTYCIAADITTSSGTITALTPKTVFHAVDYNDSNYIANCAMPSSRYIDLSTGISSGYYYTAPADGYLTINKGGTNGDWLYMLNTTNHINSGVQYTGSYNGRLFVPVQKGHIIQVQFQGSGIVNEFRFIYANSAK